MVTTDPTQESMSHELSLSSLVKARSSSQSKLLNALWINPSGSLRCSAERLKVFTKSSMFQKRKLLMSGNLVKRVLSLSTKNASSPFLKLPSPRNQPPNNLNTPDITLPFLSKTTSILPSPLGKRANRRERIVERPDLREEKTETGPEEKTGERTGGRIEVENEEEEGTEETEE